MGGMNLILFKEEQSYDITELVEEVKWSGRKGTPARSIDVTLIDDDSRARAEIDVIKGHQCIFCYDGNELFRGMIMQAKQSQNKKCIFKAYDNGIYLSNNKDTFTYTNKTLSDIFKDICARFGIQYSECASSDYRIPELTKSKTTAYDALCDAMSQAYNSTGTRHYIDSQYGSLRLLMRRDNITQWVIEVGTNIISYESTVSIEKVKTRVKLLSNEGTVLAEKKDIELEKVIGIMQEIEQPDESLNSAQLQSLASGMLQAKSTPQHSLRIEALGIPEVISGTGLYVIIPPLNIMQTFYVDEDSHIFKGNTHKMTVTLNIANDSEFDVDYKKTS